MKARVVSQWLLCFGVLLAAAVAPGLALADSASTLTVVGTSDVSDSGLMSNVIQPVFETAYPQFSLNYIGSATLKAITNAESGANGPSVLIVHAASLENQFVAGGYSAEPYGRAIFRNDFVLAGPTSDPAGVGTNAVHNIAQAFADIAAAGMAGHATFVVRAAAPGTTVAVHQIWALVDSTHLAPPGLLLCTVNAANGGGEAPIATGEGVTTDGQPCPNKGAPPDNLAPTSPAWYDITADTQGPAVVLANACTGVSSGPNSCYIFTDRGTYDWLASGTDPAATITNLKVVTSQNSASAPGGADELINYFHAYEINPSKPNETVNTAAAQDFLNLLTSPSLQTAISRYLINTKDPEGAPFVPDASPIIGGILPRHVTEGQRVALTGTVANAEIGYPAIGGVPVTLDWILGGTPIPVASALSSSSGVYSLAFRPHISGVYELSTPQASQIENSSLNPPFGDILSPAATAPMSVAVAGPALRFTKLSVHGSEVVAKGALAAAPIGIHGTIELLAQPAHGGRLRRIAQAVVRPGRRAFRLTAPLPGGSRWRLMLKFVQFGVSNSHSAFREVSLG
jgi:ABC-type tungstate transport system permease subunit